MTQAIADPWLQDDGFSRVDFSLRPEDEVNLDDDVNLPTIPHELALEPEVVQTQPVAPSEPAPPPPPPDDEPETMDLEDGTQLILKKDKGWWVGSVVGHAGGAQNYKGETKNKLILEVLKAQANATKKIREQNLKLKHKPPPPPTPAQRSGLRDLSPDEIFELNTLGQSNLAQAVEEIIKRRTGGRTLEELVTKADKGDAANRTLEIDTANNTFISRNPDYYATTNNFYRIVSYLAEYKLGKSWTLENSPALFDELAATGNWTVENLEEAFTDLSSIGKLERAPKAAPQPPPPVAVPVNTEPAPAPRPNERIVRQETRPRAGLGLRTSDVTPVPPPPSSQPPSAEDLESMSDEAIANLLQGVRRQRVVSRRSN